MRAVRSGPYHFVCGFRFDEWGQRVVLIKKNKPEWQKDKWNGVGGRSEPGENQFQAMAREFREETGVDTASTEWRHFADLAHRGNHIAMLASWGDCKPKSMTNEIVAWHSIRLVPLIPVIPNLTYLIPLALDCNAVFATIEDPS